MPINNKLEEIVTGAIGLTLAGLIIGIVAKSFNTVDVQEGYIAPNKVEITAEDLDGNGEKETILKVGDDSYALMFDENGKPVLLEYEVKSAEIQYKGK